MERVDPKNIEDILALTPVQEGMLYHYIKNPKSDYYFEQLSLRLTGEIDAGFFEKAWNHVIKTNEMLRVVFRWEKMNRPAQMVLKEHKITVRFYDLSTADGEELEQVREKDRREKFDPRDVPFRVTLCKLKDRADHTHEMIVSNHHLLYDGWSTGIILKEFFAAYTKMANFEIPANPVKTKYKEFVRGFRGGNEKSKENRKEKEKQFWKNYLEGFEPSPGLSIKKITVEEDSKAARFGFGLNRETRAELESYLKEHKITAAAFLYSAWGLLLRGYNNSIDVVFGTTVSGRNRRIAGIEDMVGLFINTLPLRVSAGVSSTETALDFLERVNRSLRERETQKNVSLVDIKEYGDFAQNEELFDTLLVVENYPLDDLLKQSGGPLNIESFSMLERTHYDLTLGITLAGDISFEFVYPDVLFEKNAVEQMALHFNTLIENLLENPGRDVLSIEMMSPGEKQRLLVDFNDTETAYPRHKTIHQLFEEQAEKTPATIALTGPDAQLSYERLNRDAQRVAALLRRKGLLPGSIAAVKIHRSIEMVVGILGILKAGLAYLPIPPEYPEEREKYILADSGAGILFTTDLVNTAPRSLDVEPPAAPAAPFQSHHPAYVIYTSGSTGKPKGVLVEHKSVVNLLDAQQKEYPLGASDTYLLKTSYAFDVSVSELFGWYPGGGRLAVLETGGEKDPRIILNTIERNNVTHINFVPSMFSAFIEYVTPGNSGQLASLQYIFLAGEALPPGLVKTFRDLGTGIPLENLYGPTEATVYAAKYSLSQWDGNGNVPIGKPLQNVKLHVLGETNRLQPIGVPGELCIGGLALTRGYLNRPELTAERFSRGATPYMRGATPSFAPLYRTGDRARWMPDGHIEYLGRIDHQVKIRGYRIEPGEIENRLSGYPKIKEAVVTVHEDALGDKSLAAYYVSTGTISQEELTDHLGKELPGYMIPSYFMALEAMPLTTSGKIDRKSLPSPEAVVSDRYIAPGNETEEQLAVIWSELLGIDKEGLGVTDNFFRLGGHSLKATSLGSRIHKHFNVKISLAEIFKQPTIRALSQWITGAVEDRYTRITPAEQRDYYLLSSAQKRLYVVHQVDKAGTGYNMPAVMELEGDVDNEKLENTFKAVIRRHESLRTSFVMVNDEPVQRVHGENEAESEFRIQTDSLVPGTGCPAPSEWVTGAVKRFIRPFDLSRAPLLRAGLLAPGDGNPILIVDMHHIVSDGISVELLIRDFTALYSEKTLSPLNLQYKDYAQWRRNLGRRDYMRPRRAYWLERFSPDIPVLHLPTDFPRPAVRTFEGDTVDFRLDKKLLEGLKEMALRKGLTVYVQLLALYTVLLSRLSGQEDIVVGSPAAGRGHNDLEPIIGIFINTLPLRNTPTASKSYAQFLEEVGENTLTAFENQDYPFEDLVEEVVVNRDAGRNPLFDVLLVLRDSNRREIQIPGLTLREYPYNDNTSKFDMTLTVLEDGQSLECSFTYNTALFEADTIRRWVGHFQRILSGVLEDPSREIGRLEILSPGEKERIIYDFNATDVDYPMETTIHHWFEEQVEKTPDRVALVGPHHTRRDGFQDPQYLTYSELNLNAGRLARLLREKGITAGTVAGIMVGPTPEMIFGILGILKAGGGYLPIDPLQPRERIAYMLNDSRSPVLVTTSTLSASLSITGSRQTVHLNDPSLYSGGGTGPPPAGGPGDILYTIYTSGTTGRSKGTLLEHGNLVNYVHWFKNKVSLGPEDRTVLTSSFGFDLGYTAIYSALLTGCQLHILPREVYLSPGDLIDYMVRHRVTYIKMTPSLFSTVSGSPGFTMESSRRLRLVLLGGEAIKLTDVEHAHDIAPHIEFMNHYGPTEATIGCVAQPIDFRSFHRYVERPTIGYPIHNMKAAVLDKWGALTPVGVSGELCVYGAGVARGYLNRPELTAEKFSRGEAPSINTPYPLPLTPYPSLPPYLSSTPLYHTGDMARWTPDGRIEFLGRIDGQVKIRGFRIELGEIEVQLLKFPGIKDTALTVREINGDKHLCAYLAVHKKTGVTPIKAYLSDHLPEYMIPSFFVFLEDIPLTPNGKLDRKALPEPGFQPEQDIVPPRDPKEETLVDTWAGVLGVKKESIGIDSNFFQLGGHSLKAILLVSRIQEAFDVKISLADIFNRPTVRGLSTYLKSAVNRRYTPMEPVEEKEYHPMSSGQKRLYLLQQMDKTSTAYNIPSAWELEGLLDIDRLERVFRRLIARHESLRTSFEMIDHEPVQRIHGDVDFAVGYYKTPPAEETGFVRPFDLSAAPHMRAAVAELGEGRYLLLLDRHHIISDGISSRVMSRDFQALYSGKTLAGITVRYKDYAQWQNRENESEALWEQGKYWETQFEGEVPRLELPTDFPRPSARDYRGSTVDFEIGADPANALKALAVETGTTLNMVLFTAYGVFLWHLTGREDIAVGFPAAGRRHADLESVVGIFINTLVLRTFPCGEKKASDFLREVKEKTVQALENQDYPYDELVARVGAAGDAGRNPLFDTMFELRTADSRVLELPGLRIVPRPFENETSKFDLTLTALDTGGPLLLDFEYRTTLFKRETIQRFVHYFINVVNGILENRHREISQIEIITEEEKDRILYTFNNTGAQYPTGGTIHRLFEDRAKRFPGRIAVTTGHRQLTYDELNRRADGLAGYLRKKGAVRRVVAVKLDRRPEMILCVLGVLKAGSAYLPVDPSLPTKRIDYMIKDGGASILLTAGDTAYPGGMGFDGEVIDINRTGPAAGGGSETGSVSKPEDPADPAYVIYTSGSTGRPKGVMVRHDTFANAAFAWTQAYRLDEMDVNLLQVAAFSFDVFGGDMVRALLNGGKLNICPRDVILDLELLHRYILSRDITLFESTPALIFPLMDYVYENRLETGSLDVLILGSDTCSTGEFKTLVSRFGHKMRILNSYGVTEATIDTSFFEISPNGAPLTGSVPIGKPLPNMKIYILNRAGRLQVTGAAGELYIGGKGVAGGYLNNPQITMERFLPDPFVPGERVYRTGDSARWLSDGNVEFLGRMDQQVKIRGFRIELGEIEDHILKYPGIKETVVAGKKDKNGDAYLCGYVVGTVPAAPFDIQRLKDDLSGLLPDYMVPSYFVQLERIPLTPNGKIDRKSLPLPAVVVEKEFVAPRNEVEKKLSEIWARVLGLDGSSTAVGIDDNFFHLGGHSLKAMVMLSRVHKEFSVKIPLAEVFRAPTIRKLAAYLKEREVERYISVKTVELKEYYALSSAQKRLYFLQRLDKDSTAYNISAAFVLEGVLDKERLENAIGEIIRRHDSFRTAVDVVDEDPVQRIFRGVPFEIEYYESTAAAAGTLVRDFVRPFDLSRAPLLRVGLIEERGAGFILLVDLHHIISDGMSVDVLMHDFTALYSGMELPPLNIQYKDYAEWQTRERENGTLLNQGEYWKKQFEGDIPVLELPTDFARPAIQGFDGSRLNTELDPGMTKNLKALLLETGATVYMVLLAAYTVFLSRLTNQEDIVVGSPTAGRGFSDLEPVIGVFINTLGMRNFPSGEKTFTGFLVETKERVLTALENQDYQYDDLVEQVAVTRDFSRNPLFDTMFILQNTGNDDLEIPGLRVAPYGQKNSTSKFDLTLIAVEDGDTIPLTFEYSTKLFKAETIHRFIGYFKNVVKDVLENRHREISEIEILPDEEKRRLLYAFNDTQTEYPRHKALHRLLEEQAGRTPDRVALAGRELGAGSSSPARRVQLTYRELNNGAGRLAHFLRAKGIQRGVIAGLTVERSIDMILGIWGILKAGGAYLPIDPAYPRTRIDYMLADSGAGILIDDHLLTGAARYTLSTTVSAGSEGSNDPAYVIYTSGSTGRPKGVVIEHPAVVNFITGITGVVPFGPGDHILSLTTISFDIFGLEANLPLTRGAKVIVGTGEEQLNPGLAAKVMKKEDITIFQATPSRLQLFLQDENAPVGLERLNYLLVGGEALPGELLDKLKNHVRGRIYNVYGPTETTVWSTIKDVTGTNALNIGKPISNTSVYILNKYRKLVPTGITGEIYIGGHGAARGYLNKPELTAEKFSRGTAPSNLTPYPSLTSAGTPGHLTPYYRTGDLGRWLEDGNLECLGRIDSQLKIRGFRIEPEEIENLLLRHERVAEAVVDARTDENGDRFLCAYIVSVEKLEIPVIVEYLSGKLPDYMIPGSFLHLDAIPLTPAGKVNRKALAELALSTDNGPSHTAPRNDPERKLAEIWAGVLNIDSGNVAIDSNFFQSGGHSLKAIRLVSKIHKAFGVLIPMEEIFKIPTIRGLARYIEGSGEDTFIAVQPVEEKDYYFLSAEQKRLYLFQEMSPHSTIYNMPQFMVLEGILDRDRLTRTVKQLVRRHESFRTSFTMVDREPVQRVHKDVEPGIDYFETRNVDGVDRILRDFVRPFDLTEAPLLRVGLVKEEDTRHILLVDMHHIISDGISHAVLVNDFAALYRGTPLPPLRVHYKDYSHWLDTESRRDRIKKQEAYWLAEFETPVPVLDLPVDYPRPLLQSIEGNKCYFTIEKEETLRVKKMAGEYEVTLYMVFLTLLNILTSKLSGNEDIVVGTVISGRIHADLQKMVGMFVNVLAVRNFPSAHKTFEEFLSEVKARVLRAFENRDYQFQDLAAKIGVERDPSRHPVFDVGLEFQEDHRLTQTEKRFSVSIPGLTISARPDEREMSRLDLTLFGRDTGDRMDFHFEYCTKLFKEETVTHFIEYFRTILSTALDEPGKKIGDFHIIPEAEFEEIHAQIQEKNKEISVDFDF